MERINPYRLFLSLPGLSLSLSLVIIIWSIPFVSGQRKIDQKRVTHTNTHERGNKIESGNIAKNYVNLSIHVPLILPILQSLIIAL
jgi:hypothetical protein